MIGLDSDFIIDFLSGIPEAVEKARHMEGEHIITTPINIFEVMLGIHAGKGDKVARLKSATDFFARTEVVPVVEQAGLVGAELEAELMSRGLEIAVTDMLIASTYLSRGCKRVLSRDKAFRRIRGIVVEKY